MSTSTATTKSKAKRRSRLDAVAYREHELDRLDSRYWPLPYESSEERTDWEGQHDSRAKQVSPFAKQARSG